MDIINRDLIVSATSKSIASFCEAILNAVKAKRFKRLSKSIRSRSTTSSSK